jgi:hypothetical protein
LQHLGEHVPPQGSGNKRLAHGADMAKAQELFGTISQAIGVNKCPQRRNVLIDGLGRMLDDYEILLPGCRVDEAEVVYTVRSVNTKISSQIDHDVL